MPTTAWPQATVHIVGNAPLILRGDRYHCHVHQWVENRNLQHWDTQGFLATAHKWSCPKTKLRDRYHSTPMRWLQVPKQKPVSGYPVALTTECKTGRRHDHVHHLCGKGFASTQQGSRGIWWVFISEALRSPDQILLFSHMIRMFQEERGERDLLPPGCLLKKCLWLSVEKWALIVGTIRSVGRMRRALTVDWTELSSLDPAHREGTTGARSQTSPLGPPPTRCQMASEDRKYLGSLDASREREIVIPWLLI